ncbi:MAG: hypothetical protein B0W54_12415 [Cellvibrio sp. 79]|nr:MAG: hypothetical protein B0W54_12415 [Cellvibrio sp. 79]
MFNKNNCLVFFDGFLFLFVISNGYRSVANLLLVGSESNSFFTVTLSCLGVTVWRRSNFFGALINKNVTANKNPRCFGHNGDFLNRKN